jgi:hypothetical protein
MGLSRNRLLNPVCRSQNIVGADASPAGESERRPLTMRRVAIRCTRSGMVVAVTQVSYRQLDTSFHHRWCIGVRRTRNKSRFFSLSRCNTRACFLVTNNGSNLSLQQQKKPYHERLVTGTTANFTVKDT